MLDIKNVQHSINILLVLINQLKMNRRILLVGLLVDKFWLRKTPLLVGGFFVCLINDLLFFIQPWQKKLLVDYDTDGIFKKKKIVRNDYASCGSLVFGSCGSYVLSDI